MNEEEQTDQNEYPANATQQSARTEEPAQAEQSACSTLSVPLAQPDIGPAEEEAVRRVLRSGWLTTGSEAAAFESEVGRYVGSAQAVAVSSATAGLHLALDALGVGPGDMVAMSPYTFVSTAHAVRRVGADPLFCDIEPDGYHIDPTALERTLIQAQRPVRAIVVVHLGGAACPMSDILTIGRKHGIPVVEDAAQAFGATDPDSGHARVGTIGTVGVYSFYANKPLTTGEGGMLVTDNEELAARARLMRHHGIDRPVWDRYRNPAATWEYDVIEAGHKYNLPDLLAALGRVQLARTEELAAARRQRAHYYLRELADVPGLRLPADHPGHVWHLFLLRMPPAQRNRVAADLQQNGIGVSLHFRPVHCMTYYAERYRLEPHDFPHAAERAAESLSIPLYPRLTGEELSHVVDCLRRAFGTPSPRRAPPAELRQSPGTTAVEDDDVQ